MEKLLEDLHQDLKELNINYKAHASIQQIVEAYKKKASEIEKDS